MNDDRSRWGVCGDVKPVFPKSLLSFLTSIEAHALLSYCNELSLKTIIRVLYHTLSMRALRKSECRPKKMKNVPPISYVHERVYAYSGDAQIAGRRPKAKLKRLQGQSRSRPR